MSSTTRWWAAIPLTVGLAVAGCGSDAASPTPAEQDADDPPATSAATGGAGSNGGGTATASRAIVLGGEQISVGSLLCYFEEQPRAGLGGVFTHTAQGRGTNAAGDDVVLDLSRARADDGSVQDDIIVDIGDPFSDDARSLRASGPEGLIEFGDASVSATDVELADLGAASVTLSFALTCG